MFRIIGYTPHKFGSFSTAPKSPNIMDRNKVITTIAMFSFFYGWIESSGCMERKMDVNKKNYSLKVTIDNSVLNEQNSPRDKNHVFLMALIGAGHGAYVGGLTTGITRFVYGPGARSPFWIWAPSSIIATKLFYGNRI